MKDLSGAEAMTLIEPLTTREIEVFEWLLLGYTNRQIAERLIISYRTVDTYRQNIRHKRRLYNRRAMMQYAIERGLVEFKWPELRQMLSESAKA